MGATTPYHHGNLAGALVEAAVRMAEQGGPEAVVLREVARTVGVSPTAAYRHFAGQADLLDAVKAVALERLATHLRCAREGGRTGDRPAALVGYDLRTSGGRALLRLVAIGYAYVDFALSAPGLFRCFCIGLPVAVDLPFGDEAAFGVLTAALDDLVSTGVLSTERRGAGLEIAAWSAVHGLAVLCLDGPLADLPRPELDRLTDQLLDVLLNGFLGK